MNGLAVASGISEGHNASVDALSRGERLRLRRERAGLTQPQMAVAAGIGVETVVNIEKDRNVQTVKLAAYEAALEAHERKASLQLVAAQEPSQPVAMTGPVHPPSTNQGDDAVTARLRELEALVEAQGREIRALRKVLDQLIVRQTATTQTRRGKGDR